MTKYYTFFEKSHGEYPDCEMECEANNKREAAKIFAARMTRASRLEGYFNWQDLMPKIKEEK